jgi:hypothetical protein
LLRNLLLNAAIWLAAAPLLSQNVFVPVNDIQFTISTGKKDYGRRERIAVKYRILNASRRPLYVPRKWEVKCPANPHVWAWFEDSSGTHFTPGYGGSCIPASFPNGIDERISKEAILLQPGEHVEDSLDLDPSMFRLPPGAYRIEAVLYGWKENEFSGAQRIELERLGAPFVFGEARANTSVILRP